MQQLLLGYGGSTGSGGGGGAVSEMMFTEPGTYDFVPPSGVTSVNVVAVGGGGGCAHYPNSVTGTSGGGGGSLSYKNNISVSSSNTYTVTVGVRGTGASTATGHTYPEGYQTSASSTAGDGGTSQFALGGTIYCKSVGGAGANGGAGGVGGNSSSNIGDGGGSGGDGGDNAGSSSYWAHGGGAGGYSGDGGHGGRWEAGGNHNNGATDGASNSGAAGGAAGWAITCGVGVFGKGTTGAINQPGSGGTQSLSGKSGGTQFGKYGGGGSGHGAGNPGLANIGHSGAVRIVWYSGSSFPSTNVDAPAGLTDEELRTKGTAIGNMTQNGGLSAAFDGTTTGDYTVSARLDPSAGAWIGKDFGENVSIKQVVITRPDGNGTSGSNCFPGSGNGSVTPMYLEHSHDGTTWQEAISSNNTSNKDLTISIGVNIVARYWRVRFTGDIHGGSVRECVFKSS
jgi:hypothetical protein